MIIPKTIPDKAYFKPKSIAILFSVPRKKVYEWIAYGKINAVNIVSRRIVRIPYESVEQFIASGGKGFLNTNKKAVTARMVSNIRHRIILTLKGETKSKKTIELLGCSLEEFHSHIKKQFQQGMTFENYGKYGWHLDHIIPCARFDLSQSEHQKICFNFKNLQPMWAIENLSKGKKVTRRNIQKYLGNFS